MAVTCLARIGNTFAHTSRSFLASEAASAPEAPLRSADTASLADFLSTDEAVPRAAARLELLCPTVYPLMNEDLQLCALFVIDPGSSCSACYSSRRFCWQPVAAAMAPFR